MKKTGIATVLLLAAAAAASPASANWFFRPGAGVSLNVGSAPNPTPNDLRILYGTSRYSVYPTRINAETLRDMDGKTVYGENGERLGMIATVDEASMLAELQLPDGRSVAVEANLLINETDRVIAPTLSLAEVMARA
jgi:hypothetical protein